ncbi:kinesin-like protein KLP2 [Hyalella azteca]|uniref:Kinesin-like protein KLP2 n=1 Tax=Hyalella azteca TaxID=294128 RepID=A0A979FLN2_HYAAZ|nr:kinesin-like protein KLP2 [Hyalella azteca]
MLTPALFSEQSLLQGPSAGVIPRCVNHLFDQLRILKLEFTMQVSFIELYLDEAYDLLSAQGDPPKLRLTEDQKDHWIIQGLTEKLVNSEAMVHDLLQKGADRRRKGRTHLNQQSSRSHTIFTVIFGMNTKDEEELSKLLIVINF